MNKKVKQDPMPYSYYRDKYKAVTIRFDRQAEADVIRFLEDWPHGKKAAVVTALRLFKRFMRGGL